MFRSLLRIKIVRQRRQAGKASPIFLILLLVGGLVALCMLIFFLWLRAGWQKDLLIKQAQACLPHGWLITDTEVLLVPEGTSLFSFRELPYCYRVIAHPVRSQVLRLYYRTSDPTKEDPLLYTAFLDLQKRNLSQSAAIATPQIKGGWLGGRGFCVEVSGRYVALTMELETLSNRKAAVVFYDTLHKRSEIKADFQTVNPSNEVYRFWISQGNHLFLYDVRGKKTVRKVQSPFPLVDWTISPDGSQLARVIQVGRNWAGHKSYQLEVYQLKGGQRRYVSIGSWYSAPSIGFISRQHVMMNATFPLIGQGELRVVDIEMGVHFRWKTAPAYPIRFHFIPSIQANDSSGEPVR